MQTLPEIKVSSGMLDGNVLSENRHKKWSFPSRRKNVWKIVGARYRVQDPTMLAFW